MSVYYKQLLAIVMLLMMGIGGLSAQNGIIKGRVFNSINGEAVAFAAVQVLGINKGIETDENGYYEITGLTPALYNIKASSVGFLEKTIYEIQVNNARPIVVDFALEESNADLKEVVIQASPFNKTEESPVSIRNIGIAEIQRNPGANRDISKVIQMLPGVTTTAAFRNDLIIRGGAPNENRFYLDDVEVPNINHFATQGASGGPVGLINVNFIREVDFYSGAFPANRGNALSSVLGFKQRDGRDDKMGVSLTAGATDYGLSLEGPLGKKTTYLVSARSSYLQFLFDALGLPFLPIYTDFQAKIKYKPNNKDEFYFIGLGAIDNFKLNLKANKTETQRYILEQLPVSTQWNYTNGLVYKRYYKDGYWTFVASRNMLNNKSYKYLNNDESKPENKIIDYLSQEIENKLRVENTERFSDYKLNYGIGYEFVKYNTNTNYKVFTNGSGAENIEYQTAINFNKYFAFAQLSRKLMKERLILSLGLRADGNSYSDDMNNPLKQLSPRFSLAYAFTPQFAFNFNLGRYYQLPPYTTLGYQQNGVFINKQNNITFISNDQIVAGFEYNTASSSKISIEGYLKKWDKYPFLLRDSISLANLGGDFGVIGNEAATSTSKGQSYGIEFLFQQRLWKGFYGVAAYTLGWSNFKDKNGNDVPSSWDSRHIISMTLGKKFGKNWEAGVNWRFQSGLPYTPYSDKSSLLANWNINARGIPNYDLLNTERTGPINTIDIRIDKKWFFKKWSLNLYLDVENLLATAVTKPALILDRAIDADGNIIGESVIENPDAPYNEQRYKIKSIDDATGTRIPSIGVQIDF